MLNFGTRKIAKQGGSCMISLPMPWIKGLGADIDTVDIEMHSDNSLRIAAIMNAKTVQEPEQEPQSVQNNTSIHKSGT